MNWNVARKFRVRGGHRSAPDAEFTDLTHHPSFAPAAKPTESINSKMRKDETAECVVFNSYLLLLARYCDFTYTFSGNGGLRDKIVASILKRCGLTPGVWDYYFRAPGKPTLWIEMKHGKNGTSTSQEKWREQLEPLGDIFEVCYSAEAALKVLVEHGYVPPGMVVFGPMVCHIRLQPPMYM